MSDEKPGQDDSSVSTNDAAANAANPPARSGSSALKLVAIGLGLTAIAAMVVGLVFWQTLRDIENRDFGVVPVDPGFVDEVDPNAPAPDSGDQDGDASTEGNRRPEMESSDDSTEAAAPDESATDVDSEQ